MPSSFARYWTPSSAASGRPRVRHSLTRWISLGVRFTFQKNVVRREEDQPPAEIAEALDDVVHVRRHVLGVPGEDDEVVEAPQLVSGLDRLEVVVRDVVRASCRSRSTSGDTVRRSGGTAAARRDRGTAA